MIKTYTLKNGTIFETVTIPKGTVLFRGLILEENMPDNRLFADMIGYHNGEAFMVSPTQNVFFYPAPYVSQVVDQFNIHVIYITNYDLELLLLIGPSEYHRGLRHDDKSRLSEIITTCTNINKKDKCGFEMKNADLCFTDKVIQEYDNIKGYIAIANTDSGKIMHQLNKFYEKNNINKLHQILPSISSNAKDDIGIPEIVLHPLHLRRPICEAMRKRMWLNEHYVQYCINNRAKFNYFPLLYVTENNVYSFEDLRLEDAIENIKKTQLPVTFTPQLIFSRINNLLNTFLSPEGYRINNTMIKFTVDLRTGFYRIINEKSNFKKNRNKTIKNNITETSLLYYNSLEPELDDNRYIIPVKLSKKDKYMIMKLIGQNLNVQDNTEYDYLDQIESRLNLGNLSLSSYIFNKGKSKKIYEISRVLDRPDLYKNKKAHFKNKEVYQSVVPRNTIHKTRKNNLTIKNVYMLSLNDPIFNDINIEDEDPNESP